MQNEIGSLIILFDADLMQIKMSCATQPYSCDIIVAF